MKRFLPRRFTTQLAVLLGIALMIAQLVNFGLILNEHQKLSLATNEGPAITHFANVAADLARAQPSNLEQFVAERSNRRARFRVAPTNDVFASDDAELVQRLGEALTATGVHWRALHASMGAVPTNRDRAAPRRSGAGQDRDGGDQLLELAMQRADGQWLTARLFTPRHDAYLTLRLIGATLALYLIVLGATLWIAARITRPLRDLTQAAEAFGGRSEPPLLAPRGPQDVAKAIVAFNEMNHRLVALLDEKDRMLGAIGHDLRTPLASLRIRLENMEPENERQSAADKIEQIAAMLDDILMLARTGRARTAPQVVDLSALAEAVVEDQLLLGRNVQFEGAGRQLVRGQPDQLRRALSNLLDNAVLYGGSAKVSVATVRDRVEVSVEDGGPGIPSDELDAVLQPFYRRESSRNRDTGGSGLGLPIARSIAEVHGGTLELANVDQGGLRSTLSLPTS